MELVSKRLRFHLKTLLMSWKYKKFSVVCCRLAGLAMVLCLFMVVKDKLDLSKVRKEGHTVVVYDEQGKEHTYNSHTSNLVFIGGHPRSGTTLMRAMLDAHVKVRCGEETRIVPRMVQMRDNWLKNPVEKNRLVQGGIDDTVIDPAIASFILETLAHHGEPAEVLCNKDPLTLKSGAYMASLFPKSKWLFMMRDGRAVIHSVIKRKVTISGYKMDDPRQCLTRWNTVVTNMELQCNEIGPERCMIVYYEQLVLHPKRWMTLILDFLDLPWEDSVLHHEDHINKPGGIRVSMVERSSDQIIKPINVDALTTWVGFYDQATLDDMDTVAPKLRKFGYDPFQNPPNYGVPDGQVVNNTNNVHEKKEEWEIRSRQLIAEMKKEEHK